MTRFVVSPPQQRRPRFAALLVCLALLQALVPAWASVVDALQRDARTPFAHVEAQSDASCVIVHRDDCALCGAALSVALHALAAPAAPIDAETAGRRAAGYGDVASAGYRAASQRAPPAAQG